MIKYREASDAAREAWFEYKATKPNMSLGVVDFVAGYNAALAMIKKEKTNDRNDTI